MRAERPVRDGLSLIEVLVVLAIFAVLVALTVSAVQRVRAAAAKTACENNLRQLALALHQYHDRAGALPPGHTPGSDATFPHVGWHTRILPYLDREPEWRLATASYAAEPNPFSRSRPHALLARRISIYFCPADPRPPVGLTPYKYDAAFTTYLGVIGHDLRTRNGVLYSQSSVRWPAVTDGSSNTLLVGERPHSSTNRFGWWYAGTGQLGTGSCDMVMGAAEMNAGTVRRCPPGPYSFGPGGSNDACAHYRFWSFHPGGGHFAWCDGSVRFLRYEVADLLPALASRAGGETVFAP